jgi:hypothetical protein
MSIKEKLLAQLKTQENLQVKTPQQESPISNRSRQVREKEQPPKPLVGEVVMPSPPRLGKPRRIVLEPYGGLEELPQRDANGRWTKGTSGNPAGPPIGIIEYIRLMTGDGRELVDHAIECLRGWVTVRWEEEASGQEYERRMPADPRYQAEARAWLAERGYGKAPMIIELQDQQEAQEDFSHFSALELREYLRLQAKAESRKALISGGSTRDTGSEGQAAIEGESSATLLNTPIVSPGTQG